MKNEKKVYITPETRVTSIVTESGFCAASFTQDVVTKDNTEVTIDKQTDGGSFEINGWE